MVKVWSNLTRVLGVNLGTVSISGRTETLLARISTARISSTRISSAREGTQKEPHSADFDFKNTLITLLNALIFLTNTSNAFKRKSINEKPHAAVIVS